MTDNKRDGGEPSMEEILASIRKIISEDTAEDGSNGQGADSAAGSAGPQASADRRSGGGVYSEPAAAGDDVLELSDEAPEDGDDAPLDLTEEVDPADDAEIAGGEAEPLDLDDPADDETGLDAGGTEAPGTDVPPDDQLTGADSDTWSAAPEPNDPEPNEPEPNEPDANEPEPDDGDTALAADLDADGDSGAAASTGTGAGTAAGDDPDGPDVGAPEAETPFLADPFDNGTAGAQAPDSAAEAALAAGAMAGSGAGGAERARGAGKGAPSADTATPLGPNDQRVISDRAEQQAVEQLASLAKQAEASSGDSAADNVDHILARMVRDALRPQLREWMDRNLPQIVERIVREEVQRMTARAQGLDDDTRY
jgi:hypothetical protein